MRLAMAISPSRDSSSTDAHLAQVHAHRVVGAAETFLVDVAAGLRLAFLAALALGLFRLGGGLAVLVVLVLDNLDAHLAEHRHDVLDLLGAHLLRRQDGVQLLEGDVAALAPLGDQPLDGGAIGCRAGWCRHRLRRSRCQSWRCLVAITLALPKLCRRRPAFRPAGSASASASVVRRMPWLSRRAAAKGDQPRPGRRSSARQRRQAPTRQQPLASRRLRCMSPIEMPPSRLRFRRLRVRTRTQAWQGASQDVAPQSVIIRCVQVVQQAAESSASA